MSGRPIAVSASILCADFTRLGEEIKRCEAAGVDLFHVDVMDGHFVPNLTIGPLMVSAIRSATRRPIEAHLMIEHPWTYIDAFIDAGADIIAVHAECYGPRRPACSAWDQYPKEVDTMDIEAARQDCARIRAKGRKAFLVLNPGTPLCAEGLLQDLDGILVMSVNPGFAGQAFRPEALQKIKTLRQQFGGLIAVDGGVNARTAPDVVRAGADILVTASYLFGAPKPEEVVRSLKDLPR